MSSADKDAAIAEWCSVTGADGQTAEAYLVQNEWNVQAAASSFFAAQDEEGNEEEADEDEPIRPQHGSGVVSSSSTAPSAPVKPPQQKKKFSSLRDLQNEAGGAAGHGHDQDDDDSDKDQEYFAGGDKSALAVQDPGNRGNRDPVRRLLETARRNGPPPPPREEAHASNFTGSGQTLGGDDMPSQTIPDPNATAARPRPMVERTLHLWADGFSVDDGPLFRYDDPANARTLEMINRGSAPLDLMNVENGQAVDVKLDQHQENYVRPKQKYKPFGGSGQRLGSPTPGANAVAPPPAQAAAPAATTQSHQAPQVALGEGEPVVTLQIRLADGTRLPSRFNPSHTIGDIYSFVNSANAGSSSRGYSLATTFPTKELSDKGQKIGDLAELKRGGVVVQKWT